MSCHLHWAEAILFLRKVVRSVFFLIVNVSCHYNTKVALPGSTFLKETFMKTISWFLPMSPCPFSHRYLKHESILPSTETNMWYISPSLFFPLIPGASFSHSMNPMQTDNCGDTPHTFTSSSTIHCNVWRSAPLRSPSCIITTPTLLPSHLHEF